MLPRQSARQPPVIVVEPRYIDKVKLADLLTRLFPPKTYAAEVRAQALPQGILNAPITYNVQFYSSDEGNGSYQRLFL
jgi:hypothetical protein